MTYQCSTCNQAHEQAGCPRANRQPWLIAGIASNWASSPPRQSEAGRLATKIARRIERRLRALRLVAFEGAREDYKTAWLAARVVARMRLDEEYAERGAGIDELAERVKRAELAKGYQRKGVREPSGGRIWRPWILGCPTMRGSFGPAAGRLP